MDSIHHSERPRQAPVVGPGEPHEIHKKQGQGFAPGSQRPPLSQ